MTGPKCCSCFVKCSCESVMSGLNCTINSCRHCVKAQLCFRSFGSACLSAEKRCCGPAIHDVGAYLGEKCGANTLRLSKGSNQKMGTCLEKTDTYGRQCFRAKARIRGHCILGLKFIFSKRRTKAFCKAGNKNKTESPSWRYRESERGKLTRRLRSQKRQFAPRGSH